MTVCTYIHMYVFAFIHLNGCKYIRNNTHIHTYIHMYLCKILSLASFALDTFKHLTGNMHK